MNQADALRDPDVLPADPHPHDVRPLRLAFGAAGAGATILVVDDADDLCGLVSIVLIDAGHTVLRASSAEEALAVSDGHHVDLLLTDVAMPGLTGPELAARLRTARPELPVVVMSGFAPKAYELPDALHLQKPFSLTSLRAQVERALHGDGAVRREAA